jgi:uncharacterized spore protein YtfJ
VELNRLFDFLERIYQRADVKAAFGEPQTIGDRTIIPVARVSYALGLGFGKGERPAEQADEVEASGAGAGGGGGGMATPIAVLEVTDEDTKVIPIVDSTRLALAGILMAAWNIFWIARTIRVLRERKAQI